MQKSVSIVAVFYARVSLSLEYIPLGFTSVFLLFSLTMNLSEGNNGSTSTEQPPQYQLPVDSMKVFENHISLHFTNRSDRLTLICQNPQVQAEMQTSVCDMSTADIAYWTWALIIYLTVFALILTYFGSRKSWARRGKKSVSETHACTKCLRTQNDQFESQQFSSTERHTSRVEA